MFFTICQQGFVSPLLSTYEILNYSETVISDSFFGCLGSNWYLMLASLVPWLIKWNRFFLKIKLYFTNLTHWLGWWCEGVVCVRGNRSTQKKSTWLSRRQPDLPTYDTWIVLVRSEGTTRPPINRLSIIIWAVEFHKALWFFRRAKKCLFVVPSIIVTISWNLWPKQSDYTVYCAYKFIYTLKEWVPGI